MKRPIAIPLALSALVLFGCRASTNSRLVATASRSTANERWRASGDYYALLEIVDTHIDPAWNGKVSRAEVVRYLGEGLHNSDEYPGAGPKTWVYPSHRPVPSGSYLFVEFGDDGFVKQVSWGSE